MAFVLRRTLTSEGENGLDRERLQWRDQEPITSPEQREPPSLAQGSIGPEAATIGAAILPLHRNFSPNRDVLTGQESRT